METRLRVSEEVLIIQGGRKNEEQYDEGNCWIRARTRGCIRGMVCV